MHPELPFIPISIHMKAVGSVIIILLQTTVCTENEQFAGCVKFPVQVAVVLLVVLGHWPQFEAMMR